MPLKNQKVAALLNEIADMLELRGDIAFKVIAYREAARNIENLPAAIESYDGVKKLMEIPKVGEGIAKKIHEYLTTGKLEYHEDLKKEFPRGLLEIVQIPGIGPKTAKLLYEKLKISSTGELEKAAKEHRVQKLPRMGAKTEDNILRGIAMLRERSGRTLLGVALPAAEEVVELLKKNEHVANISYAGSIRRMKETIGDIDVLASSKNPAAVMRAFASLPIVKEVLAVGGTKSTVLTKDALQIDLRVVAPESWGAALQYFTGSKAHNIRLRELAIKLGLKINEYGVFEEKTGKKIGGRREENIYEVLGLKFVEPELREDAGELDAAAKNKLPMLVGLAQIRGDIHVHSKWSDGSASIEEIALAAKHRGYDYIAVCDHAESLGVASGLSMEEVKEQMNEIAALNEKIKDFKILAGIEVNILSDGSVDFKERDLKTFDVVVAGIHSGLRQGMEKITSRIISAMENENIDIISHPTGRLIEKRAPYEVDVDKIFRTASETKTVLEINASPERLDLRDMDARKAKEMGIKVAISTDAHSTHALNFMKYGVATARRGWLEAKDVINTLPYEELMKTFA